MPNMYPLSNTDLIIVICLSFLLGVASTIITYAIIQITRIIKKLK